MQPIQIICMCLMAGGYVVHIEARDGPGYLPRPTPPRPIYSRPGRDLKWALKESVLPSIHESKVILEHREKRSPVDRPGHLPRPTPPRPNYNRPGRDVEWVLKESEQPSIHESEVVPEQREKRSPVDRPGHLPRPTPPRPNYNRPGRDVEWVLKESEQPSIHESEVVPEQREKRSPVDRPGHLPRPTPPRPNYNRPGRDVEWVLKESEQPSIHESEVVPEQREKRSPVDRPGHLPRPTPPRPNYNRPGRDVEWVLKESEQPSIHESEVVPEQREKRSPVDRPGHLPRPTPPRPNYNRPGRDVEWVLKESEQPSIHESEVVPEQREKRSPVDRPGHLPRPTPPRPNYNRPGRDVEWVLKESEQPSIHESEVVPEQREKRSPVDRPGHLPRPTPPRPNYNRPGRDVEWVLKESEQPSIHESEVVPEQREKRSPVDRPGHLPRPTPPRPNYNRPGRDVEWVLKECEQPSIHESEVVPEQREKRSPVDRPGHLPRPTPPRPNYNRPGRDVEWVLKEAEKGSSHDFAVPEDHRVKRSPGDKPTYLPRPRPPRL